MTTNNLGGIDAGYYESVLTNSAIGVGLWHRDLSKYQTMARTAIELALDVCRPGADMANALNSPSQTLRAAAEALAFDAIVSLGYVVSASGDDVPTLGKRIETLEAAVKKYRTQSGVSLQVYAGKKELRGDALLKALRQINYLIGGGPHFTNPNVPDGPLPIKPVFYSDFITALENFQRALEYLYASTQTLSEVRLKDSAGHLQYSIYVQDAVQVIRNETAESLKKMLDGDHVEILGTAHMLEQHGHLNAPTQSHDSFATRLFDPVAGISSIGDPVRLEEALSSDAPAILIQGEGGCGKTVALWRFGLQTNTNEYRDDIAIYTKLDGGFPSSTLNKQIAAAAHYASDSRRIYVLLDGLDEIRSRRSLVVTAIADLIARYSKLLWRVSTRELGGEPAEETRAWHLFKMDRFAVDSIVSGIRRLEHVNASMRDQAVTLIKSERPLAAVLGTAFYYALFCWRLLDLDRVGVATRVGEPRQVFRSRLLKFGLDKYVQRELERSAITATQQAIDDWIITWTKAGLNELLAVPDAARVNDQIVNPTSKHELFGDWLLASYLAKANPQDVQGALTQMPGPRRRSVLSLILEVLLLADKATALTDAMFRVDPLMAAAGFVRRNAINASVPPEYFFNQSLAAKLLKEEFDESPWLKAAVSALMCGPAHVATNEAIKEIAYQRVSSVPVSIQQTLSESAFWLLLDVQAAVYGPPNTAEILAKHVFDTPEPWAELGGYGYDYWIHYRQSLTGLSHVEQVARGAPVLDTRPSAGEQQALENLPASLQARYWLSLEARIDGQEDIEDRASLSVKWLAQHCTQLSFRLIHRLVVKRLIPKMSGTPRDFTTLIERAKQTPLLLPELFNIVPRVQVYAALKDPAILELFIAQVTPTAAAQFFRHVKPSDDPHDPHGAERQAWRDSVVTSLRDKRWCEKADPAEMQRLWEIGVIEPLSKAKKNRWQRSMRMRDASLLKRAGVQIEFTRECVEAWVSQAPSSEEYFRLIDCRAITPENAIDNQGRPLLEKVIEELNEQAILTLLERSGEAAPATEIRDALNMEIERRFKEVIDSKFDRANSRHNWVVILRIYQGKLEVAAMSEEGKRWIPILSQSMKAALLRLRLVTIKDLQAAESEFLLEKDRLASYTYSVSHRGDDHSWLMHPSAGPQPMFPTRRYADVRSGKSEHFDIKVGDAVLLRSTGFLGSARHVAFNGASCAQEGSSQEGRDSGQESGVSLDERLRRWICRSLHPVYAEREYLSKNTPFHHVHWAQQGATGFIIPTRLGPECSLASLNQYLAKGWFVVRLSHEDTNKHFWKCQGPLMGKDVVLLNRNIVGKEGRQPKLGDFLFARIQLRINFEKSAHSDGYVSVPAPVVSGPFAYLLPETLANDTGSAWWKSGSPD